MWLQNTRDDLIKWPDASVSNTDLKSNWIDHRLISFASNATEEAHHYKINTF
jgi:hypothetical protein